MSYLQDTSQGSNEPTSSFQQFQEGQKNMNTSNYNHYKPADAQLYPEANEEELVVIGALDDAIGTATEEIPVPIVDADEIGPPPSCMVAMEKFKYPLIGLSIAAVSGVLVVQSANPTLYLYFPFFACFVNFCGGIPSTKASLDSMADAVIPRLHGMEYKVKEAALRSRGRASSAYQKYVGFLQRKKDKAIESVSKKMSQQFKKNTLSQYNPPADTEYTLDSSDVTGEVQQSAGHESLDEVESQSIDKSSRSKYIPIWFRSKSHFDFLVAYPILIALFIMQLSIVTYFQLLKNINPSDEAIPNKWSPLITAATTFIIVMIQIFIAYILTKASRLAKSINRTARKRFGELNSFKKQVARCMTLIKNRLIAMIKFFANALRISGGFKTAIGSMLGKKSVKNAGVNETA
mmetsp:Transcript_18904/g.27984  ORF Transcript_18904/g.27984 Transcript_18904/m.27984 type:complete len:405 (+) Transcript_18904:27-1241(+)|eukprot:CAMPEP_0194220908 /NCGR_PEP_ID=MMETSP0156-20130528/29503_1 /TAXON_ID=33649 /ORGANISM="Thalassionema nitzschioides, Strain L26-B" /LENGTH=404 /DNA_ID=CAMNT_0038951139 /DNA_START=6 /DNA_END=1220 /DNA_ORIENTATION=+